MHFDAVIAVDAAALELVTDLRESVVPRHADCLLRVGSSDWPHRKRDRPGREPDLYGHARVDRTTCSHRSARSLSSPAPSPGDLEYERLARQQFRAVRVPVRDSLPRMACRLPNSSPALSSLPADSAIYYLLVSRDGSGQNVHPLNYLSHLTAIANAPVYCWVDSAMDHGIVGGSLKDQTRQLDALGRLALRVLSGESADGIPVSSPNLNVRQVDWRQLRRWGISESRVPRGTRVLFKQPSVWDRYRVYILGIVAVLIAQTLLIAGLAAAATDATAGRGTGAWQRTGAARQLRSHPRSRRRGCSTRRTPNVRASPANCTTISASRSPCSR